jgi:hypothetical protein
MKGQYLAVEYVLFFAIGIAMVIGVYMTFTGIDTSVREDAVTMQLEKTGELIRDTTVNIYETGKRTNSTIMYDLKIPPKLSGHTYMITYKNGLNINSTQNSIIGAVLGLYNINIKAQNIIYSTKGTIRIKYEDKQVEWS